MAHFVQIGDMAFNPDQICKIEWFNPKDGLCLEVTFTSGLHMFSIAETESYMDWWEEKADVYKATYPDYFATSEVE